MFTAEQIGGVVKNICEMYYHTPSEQYQHRVKDAVCKLLDCYFIDIPTKMNYLMLPEQVLTFPLAFGTLIPEGRKTIMTTLTKEQQDKIKQAILFNDGITVSDAVKIAGCTRSTAQKFLTQLVDTEPINRYDQDGQWIPRGAKAKGTVTYRVKEGA